MLSAVDASLRRDGYQKTRDRLLRSSPAPRGGVHRARALRIGITVNTVARQRAWSEACLRRSLVTWWLLRWAGLPAEVRFGLSAPPASKAHAWVEHGGVAVNDSPEIATLFPFQHGGDLLQELRRASA